MARLTAIHALAIAGFAGDDATDAELAEYVREKMHSWEREDAAAELRTLRRLWFRVVRVEKKKPKRKGHR